ncbi:MAG: response regulator [candidate division Zixibacteria bacterium]|nr:response regulator [candidate division Zixibacteria bacterium]
MNNTVEKLIEKRDGRPLNILIVDDEDNVRDVFRDFCLSSPLFNVHTASSGQEAIDLVDDRKFDIITIDLVMPEISGIEAIEQIKRKKPHLPVIIVTGNATDSLIEQAGQMGGCRVLHKPVGIDEFVQELVEVAEDKC